MLTNSSGIAILGILVALATVAAAGGYALRPSEQRLGLLRPLSLATLFAALCSFTFGLATILRGISVTAQLTPVGWSTIAAGAAEALVPLFVAFGCLTIAWILAAVGLRRS